MQRIFVAIEINEQARATARQQIARLSEQSPETRVSWVKPTNMHLTLRFFGDVAKDALVEINAAVGKVAAQSTSFSYKVESSGVFPNKRKPSVLWLGINEADGSLNDLKADLDEEFEKLGYPVEKRRFHPHLTIARLRQPQSARKLAGIHLENSYEAVEVKVGRIVVFESRLENSGAVYTERFSAELK